MVDPFPIVVALFLRVVALFLRGLFVRVEIATLGKLRHPNIVLFLGAVTQ